jgi:hypothetical protein
MEPRVMVGQRGPEPRRVRELFIIRTIRSGSPILILTRLSATKTSPQASRLRLVQLCHRSTACASSALRSKEE